MDQQPANPINPRNLPGYDPKQPQGNSSPRSPSPLSRVQSASDFGSKPLISRFKSARDFEFKPLTSESPVSPSPELTNQGRDRLFSYKSSPSPTCLSSPCTPTLGTITEE